VTMILSIFPLLALLAMTPAQSEPLAEVDGRPSPPRSRNGSGGAVREARRADLHTEAREGRDALKRPESWRARRRGGDLGPGAPDAEITSKVASVTEAGDRASYQTNRNRLRGDEGGGAEQIRAHLQNQKLGSPAGAVLESLRSKSQVWSTQSSAGSPGEVGERALPSRDGDSAVTIVTFEDFHCPFCKRINETSAASRPLQQKVRVVPSDFPIDTLHPGATASHEAARMRPRPGKFWPYHDTLYAQRAEDTPEQLGRTPGKLGSTSRSRAVLH